MLDNLKNSFKHFIFSNILYRCCLDTCVQWKIGKHFNRAIYYLQNKSKVKLLKIEMYEIPGSQVWVFITNS